MASFLHFEFWRQSFDNLSKDGRLIEMVASGTLPLSGTMATADLPVAEAGYQNCMVVTVYGADAAYVHVRKTGVPAPSGTGAHAASDAQPRSLAREADGAIRIPVPNSGSFGVVQAAALS